MAHDPEGADRHRRDGTGIGVGLAGCGAIIFGVNPIIAKAGYSRHLHVEEMLAWRFMVAAVVLAFADAGLRRNPRRLLSRWTIMLGLILIAQAYSFFEALRYLSASVDELVLFAYPVIIAVVTRWVLHQKQAWIVNVLIGISLVGVALVLGGTTANRLSFVGVGLASACPLLYASFILVANHANDEMRAMDLGAGTVIVAAVGFCAIAVSVGDLSVPRTAPELAIAAGLASAPAVGIPAVVVAVQAVGPVWVALVGTLEPATTVVLAALILGEHLTVDQAVGAVMIVGSAGAAIVAQRHERPSGLTP